MSTSPAHLAPLAGRRLVVTRASSQARGLTDALILRGATVVELPVIAFAGPAEGDRGLTDATERLLAGSYDWIVVTSKNALFRLLDAVGERVLPESVRWAVVGPGTAEGLRRAGHTAEVVPEIADADSLAAAFPVAGTGHGVSVLYPRAETVRSHLAAELRSKGWRVDDVVAYRTVAAVPSAEATAASRGADAIIFTSPSTVERTVEQLGADGIPPMVVTMGRATSAAARDARLEVAAEASPHTLEGLVSAVEFALARRRS
ncbi:MAG: uroporphyrinogen-III synthase [Acidimicrobiales bacterium]